MEDRRDRLQEGRFFAYEKRCEREDLRTAWLERKLSYFYDWTSEYGQSILRPILSLTIFTIGILLLYITLVEFFISDVYREALKTDQWGFIWTMLRFTLEQIHRPFQIWAPGYVSSLSNGGEIVLSELMNALDIAIRLVSTIQAVVTLGLVTETLLAVRWRFRRA